MHHRFSLSFPFSDGELDVRFGGRGPGDRSSLPLISAMSREFVRLGGYIADSSRPIRSATARRTTSSEPRPAALSGSITAKPSGLGVFDPLRVVRTEAYGHSQSGTDWQSVLRGSGSCTIDSDLGAGDFVAEDGAMIAKAGNVRREGEFAGGRAAGDFGQPFAAGRQGPHLVRSRITELQADLSPAGADQVRQSAPIEQRLPRSFGIADFRVLQVGQVRDEQPSACGDGLIVQRADPDRGVCILHRDLDAVRGVSSVRRSRGPSIVISPVSL